MLINAIEGATRRIGKSQGYIMPFKDHTIEGIPAMTTSWQPTPAEIEAIVAGAPIHVTLLGSAHPPIMLAMGRVPE